MFLYKPLVLKPFIPSVTSVFSWMLILFGVSWGKLSFAWSRKVCWWTECVTCEKSLLASPGVSAGINRSILLQSSKSDCLSVDATSTLKSRLACWDQLPRQLHSPVAPESDRRDSAESSMVAGLQVCDPEFFILERCSVCLENKMCVWHTQASIANTD